MADQEDVMFMLGEIKGQLDGVKTSVDKQGKSLINIDKRMRTVERTSAVHGALGGGVVGVGIALLSESIKAAFKANGA